MVSNKQYRRNQRLIAQKKAIEQGAVMQNGRLRIPEAAPRIIEDAPLPISTFVETPIISDPEVEVAEFEGAAIEEEEELEEDEITWGAD
jgi:hypothetical protein